MDAGTRLRTARERRGLLLTDIAARTRISMATLRAIEEARWAALPPPIFVRGFLRAYAREVALDPDDVVREYQAQIGRATPPPPADTGDLASEVLVAASPRPDALGDRPGSGGTISALALAAVALAIVAYFGWNDGGADPRPGAIDAERDAVATSGEAGTTLPGATAGSDLDGTFTLTIHPSGPCWVEVVANGERRVYRLMQRGDRETVTADGPVLLRVGDPTTFAYSINGQPGRPLAITSGPVSVEFSAATLPSFIG
jgi:cytoskeletal protein RodZ